jgi:molybdenum cofactor biosynthesis enzyme MoaA
MPIEWPSPMTDDGDVKILKQTRSLCPECLAVLDATVYETPAGEVWIRKHCPEHGPARGRIEKDAAFYARTMNRERVAFRRPPLLMVAITHRCNLNCNFCFVPNRNRPDLTVAELLARTEHLPPFTLCLTGGEPTLHPKLCEMVAAARARPNILRVVLVSNGLRLAEPELVAQLQQAGLNAVLLSFNGLRDVVYQATNGQPLLAEKLRALAHLSRSKIEVALSPTIVRGLNERAIGGLLDLILKHGPPLWQLRVRTAANVGTHRETEAICASELLALLAQHFGTDRDALLRAVPPETCYHSPYQVNLRLLVDAQRRIRHADAGEFTRGPSPPLPQIPQTRLVMVNLWAWPDRHNLDLDDIQSTGVNHMTHDGRILDFYEAIVRAEDL